MTLTLPKSFSWTALINSWTFPLVLWLISSLVNLAATGLVTGFHVIEAGDELEYFSLAKNIYEHFHFQYGLNPPCLFRTPPFPAFLALVFVVTGPSVVAGKIANCLLGGLTPVGLFYLGRLLLDQNRGALAGLVATVLPSLFHVNATLYSETLSTMAFVWVNVLIVLVLKRATSDDGQRYHWHYGHWLGLGAALGLLVFIKPQHLLFLPYLFLAGVWYFWSEKRAFLTMAGLAVLGFCLVLSPWWLRNAMVTGNHFVPFTTSGDRTLIDANNPTIAHMSRKSLVIDGSGRRVWVGAGKFLWTLQDNELVDLKAIASMNEVERSQYFRHQVISWVMNHPWDWLVLCLKKLGYGFGVWPLWQGSWMATLLEFSFLAMLLVSLPGWFYLVLHRGLSRLLLTHLLTFITVTVVFFGSMRYRNPYEGSFLLVAILGLGTLGLLPWGHKREGSEGEEE